MKITRDHSRFKDIIKGKVRDNLREYIKNDELIGKQGDDFVKISVPNIEIPKLRLDPFKQQHVASGDGDIGDVIIPGKQQGKSEDGEAGTNAGEHGIYDAVLSIEELGKQLQELLELPFLQPKETGYDITIERKKYNSTSKTGPAGLKIFRRTYKRALLRSIAAGDYDYNNPVIIPRKEDQIYKYPKIVEKPQVKAVIFYIMDVSGSMSELRKKLVKTFFFWIDVWLQTNYGKNIISRFIVHDVLAMEIERDKFYRINTSGGTLISPALILVNNIINKEYDPAQWNIYVFSASDGDTWSAEDDAKSINLVKTLCNKVNLFSYCEVEMIGNKDSFYKVIRERCKSSNIKLVSINSRRQIEQALKILFGKQEI